VVSLNFRVSDIAALLITLALSAAPAVHAQEAPFHGQTEQQKPPQIEEPWPMDTTGDISVLIVRERYRIYVEHCGDKVPTLKPALDETMKSLQRRIRSIGTRLLDSDAFRDMKQQQVSPTLVGALSSELANIRQELEEQDPAQVCPETLRNYSATTDELLEDFLKRTMAGIRSTAQTLKSRSAP
jgi:hypothetical protein